MLKLAAKIIIYILCAIVIALSYLIYLFLHTPIHISNKEELVINRGATIGQIAHQLENKKIIKSARILRYLAWYRGDANQIKAGEYLLEANLTPNEFLQKIVDGHVRQYSFTIIEGWKLSQVLTALQNTTKISHTINKNADISFIIEGMVWPDTYFYTAGTSDVELLQRAYKIMQIKLQQEWDCRDKSTLRLKDPIDAVTLASILEKETSVPSEYYQMSGVFQRRLEKNMLLQADPTVIYALNKALDFKVTVNKIDLSIDSPYNTYKYLGLPPTPIAIPSFKALHAALHPTTGDTLYFVADGKGGHIFSATLDEHNNAVAEYKKKLRMFQEAAAVSKSE